MLNTVSIFTVHYQTAASTATPPSLLCTGWTFPYKGSVLLGLPSGRVCSLCPAFSVRPILTTDFSSISFCAAQQSFAPLVPVLLCPPFPSLSPLFTRLRWSPNAPWFVRFNVLRRIVRLEHPASADCKTADPHLLPSLFTIFFLRLPLFDAVYPALKPNLSGASSQDASTLSSARSRRAGRSFVDSSRCFGESSVPASFLQQTFTDKRAPRQHRRGRRHKTRLWVLTRTAQARQEQSWRERTTIPSRRIQHLTRCSNII